MDERSLTVHRGEVLCLLGPNDARAALPAAPGDTSALAHFLGELDTFLGAPAPDQGPGDRQPLKISNVAIARKQQARPLNAFQVTFPQCVVWASSAAS